MSREITSQKPRRCARRLGEPVAAIADLSERAHRPPLRHWLRRLGQGITALWRKPAPDPAEALRRRWPPLTRLIPKRGDPYEIDVD